MTCTLPVGLSCYQNNSEFSEKVGVTRLSIIVKKRLKSAIVVCKLFFLYHKKNRATVEHVTTDFVTLVKGG